MTKAKKSSALDAFDRKNKLNDQMDLLLCCIFALIGGLEKDLSNSEKQAIKNAALVQFSNLKKMLDLI
jgi:hypothetical protein